MMTVTHEMIAAQLAEVGLHAGSTVLVHSALSSFGYVEGGADAVIDALLAVVGPRGTVMVPTLTGDEILSPVNPPIFDRATTPCWTGRIPETFRQRASAVRSVHPTHSVAAIGASAEELTREHINSITPCDEWSPYGKLAQRDDGYILLLGVDHESNTTLHHVEELVGADYHMQPGLALATLIVDGQRFQRSYMLHQYGTARQFNSIDPILTERAIQQISRIGTATVRLVNARDMVRMVAQCVRANPRFLCRE